MKGQKDYYLTTYSVPQGGAAVWQYIYMRATSTLMRYHFITGQPTQVATWHISPGGIAQAAKVRHWPAPANTPSP